MKYLTITTTIVLIIFYSCTYDKKNIPTITQQIVCTDSVHYSTDILPIITGTCANSKSCHSAGQTNGAFDYTVFSNVQTEDSAIYSRITMSPTQTGIPGFMPKGLPPLTADQIQKFYCWWKQGGQNN